jgi:tRNA A37 threonylcarbamoyladenosine dehydratase
MEDYPFYLFYMLIPDTIALDTERRFGGLQRLYGPDSLQRLQGAHVAVAGIGGVGSWCAEALARSAIGAISLIDLDHIAASNVNRQLHALTETLGQAKVVAMAQRIHGINPHCRVQMLDAFVEPDNAARLFSPDVDLIVDCTDQAAAKVAMVLLAKERGIPVVVCGGAGGKTNPLSLRSGDLSVSVNDALLARLRNTLRRRHRYPRAADQAGKPQKRIPRLGVRALWFDQPVLLPAQWQAAATPDVAVPDADAQPLQGLSCAGYGSVVTVTAAMGMAAANEAMQWVLNRKFV